VAAAVPACAAANPRRYHSLSAHRPIWRDPDHSAVADLAPTDKLRAAL